MQTGQRPRTDAPDDRAVRLSYLIRPAAYRLWRFWLRSFLTRQPSGAVVLPMRG